MNILTHIFPSPLLLFHMLKRYIDPRNVIRSERRKSLLFLEIWDQEEYLKKDNVEQTHMSQDPSIVRSTHTFYLQS
jgi:hypothetical protein